MEQRREQVYLSLSDPVLLRDGATMAEARARLATIEEEIAQAMQRWEALETIALGE